MNEYRKDYNLLADKLLNKFTELTEDKNITLNDVAYLDVFGDVSGQYFEAEATEIFDGRIQINKDPEAEQTNFWELCILSRISLIEQLETDAYGINN